ncbi:uncharacterized protein PAC_11221 [Phialocephala subalpina]|uniref:Ecp2 effector protein domain-containing protein n=1 Tax=Phialocephala subalpina TaxID=576137 RepID=A0A1L7X8H1_9HELO|nr:uncharacterized protein PAC_11221 [Phialocephala subalpina]
MQFSTIFIAMLATSSSTLASPTMQKRDLHSSLYCVDVTPAQNFQVGEEVTENNDATVAACAAYKNRNTGTNQWDTCPDCIASQSGDVTTCNSAAKHLGGDEMTYYCKQAGADRGQIQSAVLLYTSMDRNLGSITRLMVGVGYPAVGGWWTGGGHLHLGHGSFNFSVYLYTLCFLICFSSLLVFGLGIDFPRHNLYLEWQRLSSKAQSNVFTLHFKLCRHDFQGILATQTLNGSGCTRISGHTAVICGFWDSSSTFPLEQHRS